MSESKHLSKIDMRELAEDAACPFEYMKSVRCAIYYEDDPNPCNQYICECRKDCRSPQSRRQNK